MLRPGDSVDSQYFHCSPLLFGPKEANKRCVILNLSHPYGASLNYTVTRHKFDDCQFTLKFPCIDNIADTISSDITDPVLLKIDVVHAFCNLRVDPVDASKFGIKWDGKFYLDPSVAFKWTHGNGVPNSV